MPEEGLWHPGKGLNREEGLRKKNNRKNAHDRKKHHTKGPGYQDTLSRLPPLTETNKIGRRIGCEKGRGMTPLVSNVKTYFTSSSAGLMTA